MSTDSRPPIPETPTPPGAPDSAAMIASVASSGGASSGVTAAPRLAPSRPPPLSPGLVLVGRFELVRPLGSGGLAEVWLAKDRVTGTEVAIKALHAHLSRDAGLCERFRREMAVTRALDHAGIVKVFDLHEHGGRPFFAMELLRGRTLAETLHAGPLERAESQRIIREIAEALQSAHRAGVVHRDLKPQNVFVTSSGAIKLLDFGLARAAGQARMTAASTVLGTPGYIAPEVLEGAAADARADLYALGAVAFELFSGKRAFASVDAYAVLQQKRTAPPPLLPVAPGATQADERLVARCLEPDPERRFLDAAQVLRALEGQEVPDAPDAGPALTAGAFDVVVRSSLRFGQRARLKRVLERVGAPMPGFAWGTKLFLSGKATLASGASRSTSEALVAACHAEGIGAQVVPHKPRGRFATWLGRQAWMIPTAAIAPALAMALYAPYTALGRQPENWVLALMMVTVLSTPLGALGVAVTGALQGLARWAPLDAAAPTEQASRFQRFLQRKPTLHALLLGGGWAVVLSTMLSAIAFLFLEVGGKYSAYRTFATRVWSALSEGFLPGIVFWNLLFSFCLVIALRKGETRRLAEGDPAVRRLEDGIARRLAALRAKLQAAPGATQMLLADLRAAAEDLGVQAKVLATQAAAAEGAAPLTPVAELQTLPHGMVAGRDLALDRLLEIAAALDDALAVADGAGGPAAKARQEDASRELKRLRDVVLLSGAAPAPVPAPIDPPRSRSRA